MFERFSERARQVVILAQEEAKTLKHDYIGTEHILQGLLLEEEGIAARVLESLGFTVEGVRTKILRVVGSGEAASFGRIPFTPRAKKVLETSLREALKLGHNYIGTEHILLGLLREHEGVAARILLESDTDSEKIRERVISCIEDPSALSRHRVKEPQALDGAILEIRVSDDEVFQMYSWPEGKETVVRLAIVPKGES